MTTGERINLYRKQLGLSQEELGQKLMVSRQTISLWEKDQTIPTIDNLIRLKEIFGVSVDEILGCTDEEKSETLVPDEYYVMSFSAKDVKKISKILHKSSTVKLIIGTIVVFLLFISMIYDVDTLTVAGVMLGVLICSLSALIRVLVGNYKAVKITQKKVVNSQYVYKVFGDYFIVSVIKNGETMSEYKCFFKDIDKVCDSGIVLSVSVDGRVFILRKDFLKANSMFYLCGKSNAGISALNEKNYSTNKKILTALFVASLLSLFIAMIIIMLISSEEYMFFENLWVFFAFLPIPVASLIMGIVFKKRGYKCKKNIVAGIIFSFFLCVYGSMYFSSFEMFDHSDTAIVKVEEALDIEIPDPKQINTEDWSDSEQMNSRGIIYYSSDVYFEEDAVEAFEKEIEQNPMWLKIVPNDLIGITSPLSNFYNGGYFIVYNKDTKQVNDLPDKSGKYRFYYIAYNEKANYMKIDEYDVDYIK